VKTATELWNESVALTQQKDRVSFQDAWDRNRVTNRPIYDAYTAECDERQGVRIANEEADQAERRQRRLANEEALNAAGSIESEGYLEDWMKKDVGLDTTASALNFEERFRHNPTIIPVKSATRMVQKIVANIQKRDGVDYTGAWQKAGRIFPSLFASMNRAQSLT
jgi:hypothetical protein